MNCDSDLVRLQIIYSNVRVCVLSRARNVATATLVQTLLFSDLKCFRSSKCCIGPFKYFLFLSCMWKDRGSEYFQAPKPDTFFSSSGMSILPALKVTLRDFRIVFAHFQLFTIFNCLNGDLVTFELSSILSEMYDFTGAKPSGRQRSETFCSFLSLRSNNISEGGLRTFTYILPPLRAAPILRSKIPLDNLRTIFMVLNSVPQLELYQ